MTERQSVVDGFIIDIARELDAESAHIANIDAAQFRIDAAADRAQTALSVLYPVETRKPHGAGFALAILAGLAFWCVGILIAARIGHVL